MNAQRWTLIAIVVIAILGALAWFTQMRIKGLGATPGAGNVIAGLELKQPASSTSSAPSSLPVLADKMPDFVGISTWLNSPALTPADLKGKVVLIDFWTYSCINCLRTLPYVTAWQQKYQDKGFTVIGVHTPEFDFEKVPANVAAAIKDHGITYPVALDNGYGTWNAYNNEYWPAEYLFDAQGRLRATHFGEGDYDVSERNIQALLAEAGKGDGAALTQVQSTTDFQKIQSPESYVGYARQEYFGSPETVAHDAPQTYSVPPKTTLNHFYLKGKWQIGEQFGQLVGPSGAIVYDYSASNANLVMGAAASVRAQVLLDGAPVPAAFRGTDITENNGKTYATVGEQRLYDLIDAKGVYGEHVLTIQFEGSGVQAYAFTFG